MDVRLMGTPVPVSDLPPDLRGTAVPASDLPPDAAPTSSGKPVPVTPSQRDVRLAEPKEARTGIGGYIDRLETPPPLKIAKRGLDWLDRSIYEAGGAVTDNASKLGLGPQASAALGFGTNVGLQLIPTGAGGGAAKAATSGVAQDAARGIMQSALKPSKASQKSGDAAQGIEYLLQEGINVSQGGVEKLTKHIDKLDDQLTQAIARASGDVSTLRIIQPIRDALQKFRYGLDHAADEKAIRGEMLKFFNHPEVQGAFQIPAELAQNIKRAIYREVGDKGYGLGLKPASELEGKKAVARGLKEGLDVVSPEAASLNRSMGPAINARDLVQDRMMTAGNKNPIGLGIIGSPSHWLPWIADRSELAKSALARLLYSGAVPEAGGAAAGGAAAAHMGSAPKEKK